MKSELPDGHPFHDFRTFLHAIFEHLKLPVPTAIQLEIAKYLQHGGDREILCAFRGIGKSYIVCAYACWLLLNNPQIKILIVSAGESLAIDNSLFIQRLIKEIDFLQHLVPKPDQKNSKLAFDVGPAIATKDSSLKVAGINGTITGARADYIIGDDIEILKNSSTTALRDKIFDLCTEFFSVATINGKIQLLGTPQCSSSLYSRLQATYNMVIFPAEFPSLKTIEKNTMIAEWVSDQVLKDEKIIGKSTEPTRFSDEILMERKAGLGISNYRLQFLLDTSVADGQNYPLKLSDLIVMDCDIAEAPEKVFYSSDDRFAILDQPIVGQMGDKYYAPLRVSSESEPYTSIVLAIDPSGRGADATGIVVLGVLNSQIFILEWLGIRGSGYSVEALQQMADLAEKYKVNRIVVESNFGDAMFNQLLQPYINQNENGRAAIEEVRSITQKERRIISSLEPLLNQHRLILNKNIIKKDFDSVAEYPADSAYRYRGLYQLSHLTPEKSSLGKDDLIDVLGLGCQFCVDMMGLDIQRSMEISEVARWKKKAKFWLDITGAGSHQKPRRRSIL